MKKIATLFAALLLIANSLFAQTSFAPAITISGNYDHIAKGDFNHDGKTDIATAGSSLIIFLQDSVGINHAPVTYASPPAAGVDAGDLNGDGLDDIVTGGWSNLDVFYQNTLGTLNPSVTYFVPGISMFIYSIKLADVDRDGRNDVVVVSYSHSITVMYGNPSGGFTPVVYPTTLEGSYLDAIEVGKIGTDTINSIIRSRGEFLPIQMTALRIHSNRTVDTQIFYDGVPSTRGVVLADLYGTGQKQIAATYGGNWPSSHVAVWNHPNTVHSADAIISVSDIPQPIHAARLSCSNREQLVVLHAGWNKVSIIDMIDGVSTYHVGCPNNTQNDALLIADVNNDGKPDIICANTYAGISVLINTTNMTADTIAITNVRTWRDSLIIGTPESFETFDTVRSTCSYTTEVDGMVISHHRIDSTYLRDSGIAAINCLGDTAYHEYNVAYQILTPTTLGTYDDTVHYHISMPILLTATDTLSDTTHGYSLNHYYVVERPLIVSTVVVTACDTFTIVDNIKIYISKVDSIFALYHHDRVVLHCSGAPLVDTSYYTDLDTISTTVTHRDTILTSHHLGTTHNMATIITGTITRTLHAVDTVIVSTTYPVKHDTTAFLCGSAHATDSMVVTMNRVDFVHRTDSTRLVQKACDSSTISYVPYTYYDTIYTLYADTTHSLTRDTAFDMTTATTGTVTRSELLYGTTTGVTPYIIPDTVRFNCGEIRSMEFITVFDFRMDTVHRTDSSRHVVRVCNGAIVLDTMYTRYDTVTLLGKDTVRTTVRDTVVFNPDTVMTASVSYLDIDTSEENIEVYSSRDTIKTDEMLVITRYDTIVSGYLIDSFLYMHWDTTVSNHCTGALLYYGADSLYGSRYGTYTDTVTSVAFDTIRLIHDEPSIKIKVYPNPFFDHITVEGPGKIAGALYAINGQKIGEFSGIGKVEISTTNLALGTYMLVVYIDDKQTIEKMVKIE